MNDSVKLNSLRHVSQWWNRALTRQDQVHVHTTASLLSIADVDSGASRSNVSPPTVPLHLVLMLAGPVSVCIDRQWQSRTTAALLLGEGSGRARVIQKRSKTCQRFCPSSSSLLFSPAPAAPGSRFSRTGAIFSFYNHKGKALILGRHWLRPLPSSQGCVAFMDHNVAPVHVTPLFIPLV